MVTVESQLIRLIERSIKKCIEKGVISLNDIPPIELSEPKREEHGDLATNIALILASKVKQNPMAIAQAIVKNLPSEKNLVKNADIAKPGFINIVIEPSWYLGQLDEISKKGDRYGHLEMGKGRKVQVEFVSANPTGPLHIGHGRGAVYGDVLGNLLKAAGYDVVKEYYVNDAGVQIATLGRSIYLRFQEQAGKKVDFPEGCYQGSYIADLATEIKKKFGEKMATLSENEAINFCGEYGSEKILNQIKDDLAKTGVVHDTYFFENHLYNDAAVERSIQELKKRKILEEKDGALWFKSTEFGDDKDRVLRKSDGSLTYFASDIAYHKNKFDRGFERVIDVWGADHGGYVKRMESAVKALGYPDGSFTAVLIQLVNLMKDGEVVSMSTRRATYETLEDVRNEVGKDVCRYFFLMRSHNAQLDFDLTLAKKETSENPVFYIQYAHARISSVFRKAEEAGIKLNFDSVKIDKLDLPEEAAIARKLSDYPKIITESVDSLEPHRLSFYLLELAKQFQSYYSKGRSDKRYKIITPDKDRTIAKLYLLKNCRIVLKNALDILGITAPEQMSKEEHD